MTRLIITLLVVLILAPTQAQATVQIEARLDRDTVQLGESLTLTVEVQSAGTAQPDFSQLSADFHLLGTQSSHQLSMVDGARTARTVWTVELQPRHEGRITIPALAFGKVRTAPLQLTVIDDGATGHARDGAEVFLEVDAQPLQPWVQQQGQYTVKLFYRELSDGNLELPQAEGAVFTQVGDDQRYQTTIDGKRYRVLERRYALTPQRSGAVVIAPLRFRGVVPDPQRRGWFGGAGRQVSAQSPPVTLDVQARPDHWPSVPWLPARDVQLSDQTALPAQVHVGEPVTRTIHIRGVGTEFSQLPQIELAAPSGAEMYADQAQVRTQDDGQWLIGERSRKFAFVPDRPGIMELPGFQVQWWNTQAGQLETASLPSRLVDVLPAAALVIDELDTDTVQAVDGVVAPADASHAAGLRLWKGVAAVATLLWLATGGVLAWRLTRREPKPAPAGSPVVDGDPQRRFLRACERADWPAAEHALLAWASVGRTPIRSLGQLLPQLGDPRQVALIGKLQQARYGGGPTDDMGAALQRALRSGLSWAGASGTTSETTLPPLYPHMD